ncbi:MAG: hypothetical protein ACRERU_23660 [Methylococcales bacterium]
MKKCGLPFALVLPATVLCFLDFGADPAIQRNGRDRIRRINDATVAVMMSFVLFLVLIG